MAQDDRERRYWLELSNRLDGELQWERRSIDSSSRVRPWKISFMRKEDVREWQLARTQLTVFGEARTRRFAIHRDSLPSDVLRAGERRTKEPTRARKAERMSRYKLSQFLVDVAPRWAHPAPRAAIRLTDQGAADWILVDHEHVALGWEHALPTLDQLAMSIQLLQQVTAPLPSQLPFR